MESGVRARSISADGSTTPGDQEAERLEKEVKAGRDAFTMDGAGTPSCRPYIGNVSCN